MFFIEKIQIEWKLEKLSVVHNPIFAHTLEIGCEEKYKYILFFIYQRGKKNDDFFLVYSLKIFGDNV